MDNERVMLFLGAFEIEEIHKYVYTHIMKYANHDVISSR
jgi:hypothetical protein